MNNEKQEKIHDLNVLMQEAEREAIKDIRKAQLEGIKKRLELHERRKEKYQRGKQNTHTKGEK